MADLTKLDHALDEKKGVCRVIVETPKGKRAKYDYDRETKLFEVKTLLPEGMSFPLDFGFVPSTLCDDGDPLDVMVLNDEPAFPGALLQVRPIGVLEIEEREDGRVERNDRILAISSESHLYAEVKSVEDLPRSFIEHLSDFWMHKAELDRKALRVLGVRNAADALKYVRKAIKAAKQKA